MSKRDWKLLLMDILECINKIEKYVEAQNYEQFMEDEKTKDAVVRELEIIGEAANQVPKEIQRKFISVPWAQIIAMRNRMNTWLFRCRLPNCMRYRDDRSSIT